MFHHDLEETFRLWRWRRVKRGVNKSVEGLRIIKAIEDHVEHDGLIMEKHIKER